MVSMHCPRCDRPLQSDDRFCGRCGLARSSDGKPVDPLLGITVAGRYRIEERIGVGGMATVYRGAHIRLGQTVAIKILHERYAGDQKLTQRFEKEAQTLSKVNHPNLVGLHDYGRTPDGTFFMVLEYCRGTALSRFLREHGRFDARLAVDIVTQLAQGLGAAHELDIVHRDLKPENVILTEIRPGRFHARLLDFGIAKRIDDEGPKLTQAGMVFGTPEYMAPEQARGRSVDGRSDLYSLGTVFYELITGTPPFSSVDKLQVMHRQANEAPEPPSSRLVDHPVPPQIESVVMRCLEKDPAARYQNASELLRALDAAIDNSPDPVDRSENTLSIQTDALQPTEAYTSNFDPEPSDEFEMASMIRPRSSENMILELDESLHDIRDPRRGHKPPVPALGLAVLLFCGMILLAVMSMSGGDGDEETQTDSPTPIASPAVPDVKKVQTPAKRVVQVPAAKPARPPGGESVPVPSPETVLEKKAKEEAARKQAELKAAQKRKKNLKRAQKAFTSGRLKRAQRLVDSVLAGHPEHQGAKNLAQRISRLNKAVSAGRTALKRHDCVRALKVLEPVMKDAPKSLGLMKLVEDCRQALPPRQP